jgi:hypothetical protein
MKLDYDLTYDSLTKKILKYLVIFIVTIVAIFYVPDNPYIVAAIVTSVYVFIEMYYPSLYICKKQD